jgi:hypothetical protein
VLFELFLLRFTVASVLFEPFHVFLLMVAAAACGACLGARVDAFILPFCVFFLLGRAFGCFGELLPSFGCSY